MRGSPDAARDAEDSCDEDELGAGEGRDLVDDVDDFLDKDEETDQEDAPDWFFEEGEAKSSDPGYVFCPAPHLFTKHFCQHPLFPECDGVKTAECIRLTLSWRCISFAISEAFKRCGVTCGTLGTHRRCGDSGLIRLPSSYLVSAQQWASKTSGAN